MGNLLFYPEGFCFNGAEEENRESLGNFLKAGRHARLNGDQTYSNDKLHDYEFHWGNFYQDFAYSKWSEISKHPHLSWINQALHQLLAPFLLENPSGRKSFADFKSFCEAFPNDLNGMIGGLCNPVPVPYVSCIRTWQQWRVDYYQEFPEKYIWKSSDNDFLANTLDTKDIMVRELKAHSKMEKLCLYNNDVGLTFHNEVMRHKGAELKAYTLKIGGEIAKANFYKYEKELSDDESRASKNAFRAIYSFIGKSGKNQYISVDTAHGMFEFHDHTGKHLGEFRFDGGFNSPAEKTHDLKTI